jgi:hypothetical protein
MLENRAMQLKAIAFDWGHTVMDEKRDEEVPFDVRPIHVMPGVLEVLPHYDSNAF